jgi:16S rRNA (cytosine967-C5)-methyltransferase
MTLPFPAATAGDRTARGVALRVLLTCRSHEAFVQEILNHYLTEVPLAPADRRLVTQLSYGVLRRRGTLDTVLRALTDRPPHRVNPVVWEALRLGAFQLSLLTHVPPPAAINETVELVGRWAGGAKVKGFTNGILRSLSRLLTEKRTARPGPDALPLEAGEYRRLARAVLPDPATRPVEYLTVFSLPRWLAQRWSGRYPWEECVRLGFWFAGPAPLWLRVNPLRTDRTAFLAALREAGIAAEPGEHPQAVRLGESAAVRELPGYEQGWFTVQDQSAMRVASALDPQPGWRVLDMCAAPGGKTTHLAELMQDRGEVVACDVDDDRLRTVAELSGRLGITIVQALRLASGGRQPPDEEPPAGPFDAVLVDVPCSNTGVLGRRPEVRWRLKPGDFAHLAQLQTKLLLQAGERVRPGGVVVYSTCSTEPEENGAVVRAALQGLPELALEAEEEQVPGRPADGGYWARLRRRG